MASKSAMGDAIHAAALARKIHVNYVLVTIYANIVVVVLEQMFELLARHRATDRASIERY